MKKKLILFSSLLLASGLLVVNENQVQAAEASSAPTVVLANRAQTNEKEFDVDGVRYEKLNDTDVKIKTHVFNQLPETLVITETVKEPDSGKTYKLTTIDPGALGLGTLNEVEETANLKNVTLPNNIKILPSSLFSGQSKLEIVTLPNKLEEIKSNVFAKASSLQSITLPNTLTSIGNSAFANTGLRSIVIPDSVTLIDQLAFSNTSLESVKLPNGLTTLINSVFSGNQALKTINIPDSVTSIESYAFKDTGLTEVRLPKGLIKKESLAGQSFYSDSIEKITFTSPIEGGMYSNIFLPPVKAGYIFEHWVGSDGQTYAQDEIHTPAKTGNITLTAKWKESTIPQPSKGQSDATITLRSKQPTGSLSFGDVTQDAKIVFNELTLNGKEQTTVENSAVTDAKVIINDTRSDKKLGWKVSAKYSDTNFSSKNMRLALKPTSANTTGLKNIILTNTDLELFNDGGKTNEKYAVALKPELTIPADLNVASEMKTQIQWTLTPEVP